MKTEVYLYKEMILRQLTGTSVSSVKKIIITTSNNHQKDPVPNLQGMFSENSVDEELRDCFRLLLVAHPASLMTR